jgi:hypothetical protein
MYASPTSGTHHALAALQALWRLKPYCGVHAPQALWRVCVMADKACIHKAYRMQAAGMSPVWMEALWRMEPVWMQALWRMQA